MDKFSKKHPPAREPLNAWLNEVLNTTWDTPQDIKERYRHASFLANNSVIFNIGGNKFRLYVKVTYSLNTVLIKEIYTHAEYDRINFKKIKE